MDDDSLRHVHDDNTGGGDDNGQGVAGLNFFAWVVVFLCGREGDSIEETALFGGLGSLFGEDEDEDTASPSVGDARPWFRRIWGGESVAAADVEALVAAPTLVKIEKDAWSDFVAEANSFIKWVLTEIFLFVPAKYLSQGKSWVPPHLSKLQQKLPNLFLPSICLYALFLVGSSTFKSEKLKRIFQVAGLTMGASSAVEAFLFVGFGAPVYFATAMVVFFILLCAAKLYDSGIFS